MSEIGMPEGGRKLVHPVLGWLVVASAIIVLGSGLWYYITKVDPHFPCSPTPCDTGEFSKKGSP